MDDKPVTPIYPFQEEILAHGALSAPGGCILQLPTGTGKTWLAKQEIERTIACGHRAIYVTPLRAQAEELRQQWIKELTGISVGIFTGDYGDGNQKFPTSFADAQLLIMTPERLDACTRFWRSHWNWIPKVDLLVIDEVHLLGEPRRGPKLEGAISRLRQLNPFTRILGLSATLGNRSELADWIEGTEYSTKERPIPLQWRTVCFKTPQQKPALLEAELRSIQGTDMQALVFVHSRRRAEQLAQLLREHDHTAAHHHAGLKHSIRTSVEADFREHKLQILVCTPTLEMGVNLPARFVFLYDLQAFDGSGFVPLSVNQVWQRAGRAGRPGYDTQGEAVLFTPTWDNQSKRYIKGKFEPIFSRLDQPQSMAEQIVTEVASGLSRKESQLKRAFNATLAHRQDRLCDLNGAINEMREAGMLTTKTDEKKMHAEPLLKATPLARVAVRHLITPKTVLHFKRVLEQPYYLGFFDLLLTITSTDDQEPLIPMGYEALESFNQYLENTPSELISLPAQEIHHTIGVGGKRLLTAMHTAHILYLWTELGDEEEVAKVADCYPFEVQRLIDNATRQLRALHDVENVLHPPPDKTADILPADILPLRERISALLFLVQSGLPSPAASLASIKGIGPKLARSLHQHGICDIEDLANTDAEDAATIQGLSQNRAQLWINAAEQLLPLRPTCLYREERRKLAAAKTTSRHTDLYRARRALDLNVQQLSINHYRVTGGTEPHLVEQHDQKPQCDCMDFTKGNLCKHLIAVQLHQKQDLIRGTESAAPNTADAPLDVYQLWNDSKNYRAEEPRVAA